jgi:hypothetical protein
MPAQWREMTLPVSSEAHGNVSDLEGMAHAELQRTAEQKPDLRGLHVSRPPESVCSRPQWTPHVRGVVVSLRIRSSGGISRSS